MPVSVDCPSCKGRLLFPDQLWQQRFAQRVQRLKCKKCANVVSIDGRSAGSGSDADLEEEEAEATVRMLLPSLLPESWALATSEVPPLSAPPTPALARVPSNPPARRTAPPAQPQTTSGRVSRLPARRAQSQLSPTLSVASARLDAAVALEAAPPCELSTNLEAPAQSSVESRVTLVTESSEQPALGVDAKLELPRTDSKPASVIVQIAAPRALPSQPRASVRTSPLAGASSVGAKRPGEGRKRWLVLSGLAVMALSSVRGCMLGSTDPQQLTVRAATLDARQPPLTGASVASTPVPENVVEAAAKPAAPDNPDTADRPDIEDSSVPPKKLGADARGQPSRRAARKAAPSADAAHAQSVPPYDKATLAQALSAVVQKAEHCDLWGRATGTAKLIVTFAPTGNVTDATLVGEPLESAAVARCILHHARAAALPPFAGPAFTVSRTLTLR